MNEITPEMNAAVLVAAAQKGIAADIQEHLVQTGALAAMIKAALAAAPAPQPVAGSFTMSAAVQSVFPLAEREDNGVIAAALTAALGSDPYCWLAITGTAGEGEGCSKFFFMETLAKEHVQRHGGYIKPLYAAPPAEIDRLKTENERLAASVRFTLSDGSRLLQRSDVEGICPTPDDCFCYGPTVRCGPCTVAHSKANGVEVSKYTATIPEVARLKRHIAELEASEKRMREALEGLLDCPAIADVDFNDPEYGCCESAKAESRARTALTKAE